MNRKFVDSLTTLSAASRDLGVPRSTLTYWTLTGWIRKYQFGPVALVDKAQVQTVIASKGYESRKQAAVA
jgi:hypothetical protein